MKHCFIRVQENLHYRKFYSGILPTLMAPRKLQIFSCVGVSVPQTLTISRLKSRSGSGRSNVGTLPDTLDCTPAARQIQAVGGIGSQ